MKNIQLHFIYATVNLFDVKKSFTFVTLDSNKVTALLEKEFKGKIFPEIHSNNIQKITETISYKKDKDFYQLCEKKFSTLDYVKYEGEVYLESDINHISFKTDLLMESNSYVEKTPLEKFLSKYNILKSYYNGDIHFSIKATHSEYSREHGQRDFHKIYETKQITIDMINYEITNQKSTHIYSGYDRQYISKIYGINDLGEKISITLGDPRKTEPNKSLEAQLYLG